MFIVKLIEPPCTERYARWCERSEISLIREISSYSIAVSLSSERRACSFPYPIADNRGVELTGSNGISYFTDLNSAVADINARNQVDPSSTAKTKPYDMFTITLLKDAEIKTANKS